MLEQNMALALHLLPLELLNTLYMSVGALVVAIAIGLPLGILLFVWDRGGLRENITLYRILGVMVNVGRSIPFAILMIVLIPFTRLIVGTSLGTSAAIVPLSIAASAFFARLVEIALKELDRGIIEATQMMGASPFALIVLLLREALPSLIQAATVTLINLIGYSAMAGLVGGGGLGKIAFQYGYQRFNGFLMSVTLLLLLFLVEAVQYMGNRLVRYYLNLYSKL